MITIYQFKLYDITTDNTRISRRWGTRIGIARVCGTVLEESEVEVEASVVDSDIEGMTAIDFDPRKPTGLKKKVSSAMRRG